MRNLQAVEVLRRAVMESDRHRTAEIAAKCGMDPTLLRRKLNPTDEGCHIFLSEILPIVLATDDDSIIEWLAMHRGGAFYRFASITGELSGSDMLREGARFLGEAGRVCEQIDAILEDGQVDANEVEQFRTAAQAVIKRLGAITARLVQMAKEDV